MEIKKINTVCFSPNGSTKEITRELVKGIGHYNIEEIDLTFVNTIGEKIKFKEDELVIIAMPVYADRLPSISDKIFSKIEGHNTPAVVVVSYGNRDYGDALLELRDKAREKGFKIISGAAIVGEHCLNTNVAKDRPDAKDKLKILEYSKEISNKLKNIEAIDEVKSVVVKGSYPYPPFKNQHTPRGDSKCIQCGKCEMNCPVGAISKEDFRKTDSDICIFCGKCIQVCPTSARDMKDESFLSFLKKLETITEKRREIEVFF